MQGVPFRFPRLTPTVKKLLILLAGAFVTLAIVQNLAGFNLFGLLALEVGTDRQIVGWLWQPLTYWLAYPPVPDALLSFALQLLFVYFFLAPFEEAFGAKRTVQLIVVGVVSFVLAALALAPIMDAVGAGGASNPIYGAAGIALAAFGAFPVIAGNREILFMFVIPMKVWTAIVFGLAISALLAVLARDPYILATYSAALGAGVGYAKWLMRPRTPARPKGKPQRSHRRGPNLKVVRGGADEDKPRYLN